MLKKQAQDSGWLALFPGLPLRGLPHDSAPGVSYSSTPPECSYDYDQVSVKDQVEQLTAMFPTVSEEGIKFLYKISNQNAVKVTECLVDLTLEGIMDLLRPIIICDSARRLSLDEEDSESEESLAEALVAFYKDCKFNGKAAIRVCIPNQPVIDTGGARRQLFAGVLATLAKSHKFGLFEGPPGRLRPVFKQSSISSGMLSILGKMIGHSIIMDTQGFPFLSPPCYYYMCGYPDKALSLIQREDVGEHVNHIITQVHSTHFHHRRAIANFPQFECCVTVVLLLRYPCSYSALHAVFLYKAYCTGGQRHVQTGSLQYMRIS